MAALGIEQDAALERSRRKMQAWRRQKNRIALFLSMSTMVFWPVLAGLDSVFDRDPRRGWHVSGVVYRNDAAA